MDELITAVRRSLELAGLPVFLISEDRRFDGVRIWSDVEVSLMGEESGVVFAEWRHSAELVSLAMADDEEGSSATPESQYYDAVGDVMRAAMISILTAAGFLVAQAPDDSDYFQLLYIQKGAEPPITSGL
ncbi:hypothetical protein [Kineosporia babensis]